MIKGQLKILIVEDELSDYRLIEHQIKKIVQNPILVHVNSFVDFTVELKRFVADIVLCDYRFSGFTGMEVLEYTKKNAPGTYLVFVTGTVNDEEIAANTILNGASGYILKKHMPVLHQKLLPHFEKIVEQKKEPYRYTNQKEMLENMHEFIERAIKENDAHVQSYLQIKKSLEQLKKPKKDA